MYHELSISTCSILRYSSSYPSLVKQIHQISLVTSLSWVAFKIWFYFRIQVEIKPWSFSCETVLSKLCFLGSQAFLQTLYALLSHKDLKLLLNERQLKQIHNHKAFSNWCNAIFWWILNAEDIPGGPNAGNPLFTFVS